MFVVRSAAELPPNDYWDRFSRGFISYLLACCLLVLCGCTSSDYAPVSGSVSFEGSPVGEATVTFQQTDGGQLYIGTTGPNGEFTLSPPNSDNASGIPVGNHRVMISAIDIAQPQRGGGSLGSLNMASAGEIKIKHRIPPRYSEFDSSGLTFEVEPGSNLASFDLTK